MKSYLQLIFQIGFIDYAKSLIAEMEVMAAQMKKFDLKVPTKLLVGVWCKFGNFAQNTSLQNLAMKLYQVQELQCEHR
jgi:hypothetical protein